MKTPQEKKRLSYAKDRRNTYGEHSKGSRKAIPLNKRLAIRHDRRGQQQALLGATNASEEDDLTAIEGRVRTTKRRTWAKSPDTPLGQVLAWRGRIAKPK